MAVVGVRLRCGCGRPQTIVWLRAGDNARMLSEAWASLAPVSHGPGARAGWVRDFREARAGRGTCPRPIVPSLWSRAPGAARTHTQRSTQYPAVHSRPRTRADAAGGVPLYGGCTSGRWMTTASKPRMQHRCTRLPTSFRMRTTRRAPSLRLASCQSSRDIGRRRRRPDAVIVRGNAITKRAKPVKSKPEFI